MGGCVVSLLKAFRWFLLPLTALLSGCSLASFPLLDPAGPIGQSELKLIIIGFVLMLIPVIPVIGMTFWFAYRYRSSNTESTYAPRRGHSKRIEAIIWGGPILIVLALSILAWITTHQLDPYKPLASRSSNDPPVHIEAVALNWKWLFIYPKQHIATVNRLVFPVNVPLNIRLTSDTVMTAFLIPRLGSQIYAMAGMRTRLHLLASKPGKFMGWNSQLSGEGFAGMHFEAIATSRKHYEAWLQKVRQSPNKLDMASFRKLEKPSRDNPPAYYSSVQPDNLFAQVIRKYRRGPTHPPALARTQSASKK